MNEAPSGASPSGGGWIGPALLGALLLWVGFVHHGIGPIKPGRSDEWYTPTNFLLQNDFTYAMVDPPGLAFLSLGLPALLCWIGILVTTRSALVAATGLACVVATQFFTFYGVVAPFAWQFFGWSASVVLILISLVFGFALAAPLLARSWLRLSWPLRIAAWLPFVLFVVVFLRNATGTDPSLPFAISPWPVVPVFGLEVGALFVATVWIGIAIGLAGIARSAGSAGRVALAVLLGLATPALLLLVGANLHLLPFGLGRRVFFVVAVVTALGIAAASRLRLGAEDRTAALRQRTRHVGVGAALLAIPLVVGQAWAYLDYHVTREVRARAIIDALASYLDREALYPDDLGQLVSAGDLAEIPRPAIGFDALYDGEFDYQSFGTSYLIEFPAPRWVQCAYTPAAVYEEDEEEEYDDEELAALGESWSCPSRPPELW